MKGISAVIAVVLILMITIAIAALAYTWFTGVFTSVSGTIGTAAETATQNIAGQLTIDAASFAPTNAVRIGIRNTGSGDLDLATLTIYINDISATIPTGNLTVAKLTQGNSTTFTAINTSYVYNKVVKATVKGTTVPATYTIENGQ